MHDRLDHADLVHRLSHSRQVFADLRAGDVAGDRRELTAVFDRSVRLHIERVDVAHSTGREQQDAIHRLCV